MAQCSAFPNAGWRSGQIRFGAVRRRSRFDVQLLAVRGQSHNGRTVRFVRPETGVAGVPGGNRQLVRSLGGVAQFHVVRVGPIRRRPEQGQHFAGHVGDCGRVDGAESRQGNGAGWHCVLVGLHCGTDDWGSVRRVFGQIVARLVLVSGNVRDGLGHGGSVVRGSVFEGDVAESKCDDCLHLESFHNDICMLYIGKPLEGGALLVQSV